ncbi:DsbA family protein [Dictyobacter vulcani]
MIVPVNAHDHAQGPATAPVTLVEYGDYECPDCGDAYPVVKELQKRLGDKLRFVYRNFPLNHQHPHAQHASEVAEAAGDQGKFWEMHDLLYEKQQQLEDAQLLQYADQLGLDRAKIQQALDNHTYTSRIKEEISSGTRSGVNGTPTFFINGQRHNAAYDVETLLAAINKALEAKN